MKASELIKMLQKRIEEYGDLDCTYQDIWNYGWAEFDVEYVEVDFDCRKEPIFKVR